MLHGNVPADVRTAARILEEGGVVAIPTETVYGLAADIRREDAIARVFAIKERPTNHPLIVHVEGVARARSLFIEMTSVQEALATAFWPGPLTMIAKKSERVPSSVTGGHETVAVRWPSHPVARALLAHGFELAAPSANRFGRVSPTRAEHVALDLGNAVDAVLDGGPCSVGVESTILDLSTAAPRVLRPGAITPEEISTIIGQAVVWNAGAQEAAASPGTHASHYAPRARVTAISAGALDAAISRSRDSGERVAVISTKSPSTQPDLLELAKDDRELASRLYELFRRADLANCDRIFVTWNDPLHGVGLAIQDRVTRAGGSR